MYNFYKVYTETEPIRIKLEEMRQVVETKLADLKVAKDSLEKVNARIRELEKMFNEKIAEKDRLTKEIQDCEIKLERA